MPESTDLELNPDFLDELDNFDDHCNYGDDSNKFEPENYESSRADDTVWMDHSSTVILRES